MSQFDDLTSVYRVLSLGSYRAPDIKTADGKAPGWMVPLVQNMMGYKAEPLAPDMLWGINIQVASYLPANTLMLAGDKQIVLVSPKSDASDTLQMIVIDRTKFDRPLPFRWEKP